ATRKGDGCDGPAPHPSAEQEVFPLDAAQSVVTTAEEAAGIVAELLTTPVVGLDTETTGLDPRNHRVRLVQVAAPDGPVYVFDLFRLDVGLLAPLFDPAVGPVLVGH